MMKWMISAKQNLKVLNSIIAFVLVFMMNNLAFAKRPTEVLFHDMPMFKNAFSFDMDEFVSMVDCPFSVSSFFTDKRISVSSESHVMFLTKFGSMDMFKTFMNLTDIGMNMYGKSSCGIFNHSVHNVSSLASILQQKQMDANKNNREKWVNSVKPQTGKAVGNTEPSQGYIFERCNDYRRSLISLITGKNAHHESDEIVYSL